MGGTLTQPCRVREDGSKSCKPLLYGTNAYLLVRANVSYEQAPANYVPAAAVIRRVRALLGVTGLKGCVGGLVSWR